MAFSFNACPVRDLAWRYVCMCVNGFVGRLTSSNLHVTRLVMIMIMIFDDRLTQLAECMSCMLQRSRVRIPLGLWMFMYFYNQFLNMYPLCSTCNTGPCGSQHGYST